MQEHVAKAHVPPAVPGDELLEPLPGCVFLGGKLVDDIRQQIGRERLTEHGELSEKVAVVVGEAVDARRDDFFYRVWQGVESFTASRSGDQLTQEERVSPGALDERAELTGRQRRVLGHDLGERDRRLLIERPELDPRPSPRAARRIPTRRLAGSRR